MVLSISAIRSTIDWALASACSIRIWSLVAVARKRMIGCGEWVFGISLSVIESGLRIWMWREQFWQAESVAGTK